MSLSEIAAVVDGRVVHDHRDGPEGLNGLEVPDGRGVLVDAPAFVDSRVAEPGGLFVAVVGERVDGHDYAAGAVAAGAAAVLSSRDTGEPGVLVADPVAALALLARHVLGRLPDLHVVALTGSQGKTSTKDLLAQVLAQVFPGKGRSVATYGSFNNELGMPLTVLRADASTEFLVLEMGARHIGDLRASCEVARPEISLVLNVGKAHIGEFGSRDAIAVAKGELVEALDGDGVAVLNADDPRVAAMAARTSAQVRTFGSGPDADVRFDELVVDALGRPSFTLHRARPDDPDDGSTTARVELGLVGEHHAANATAAATVALALGARLDAVAAALGSATATSRGRMEVAERPDGVTVIDDAYNANPDSMRAALEALAAVGRGRPSARLVAVLGEMRELGASATEEHEAVGTLATSLHIHQLLVVGEAAKPIHRAAERAQTLDPARGRDSVFVADTEAAGQWLRRHLVRGDVVLFKASNAVRLSQVAQDVLTAGQTAGQTDGQTDAKRMGEVTGR